MKSDKKRFSQFFEPKYKPIDNSTKAKERAIKREQDRLKLRIEQMYKRQDEEMERRKEQHRKDVVKRDIANIRI